MRKFALVLALAVTFVFVGNVRAQVTEYNYVLSTWQWNAVEESWRMPDCSISGIDLRSIPEMSERGIANGYGMFAIDTSCPIPLGAINLGVSTDVIVPALTLRNIESVLGLNRNALTDSTTVEVLAWELLTSHSDPTGLNGPKPLMPDRNLRMMLRLHDIEQSERFDVLKHPKVIESLRIGYESIRDVALESRTDIHRKAAGYWKEKYGFDIRTEERKLDGITAPETTINESWGCVDNAISIDCDLTWNLLEGTWRLNSFQAENTSNCTGDFCGLAAATTILSSADMYTETGASVTTSTFRYAGPAVRLDNSTDTGYIAGHRANISNTVRIGKIVSGVFTTLGVASTDNPGSASLITRLTVDGSEISYFAQGATRIVVTDTSIDGSTVGGLYAGIYHNMDGNTRAHFSSFEASDELAPPTPTPTPTPGGTTVIDITSASFIPIFEVVGYLIGWLLVFAGIRFSVPALILSGMTIALLGAIALGIPWLTFGTGISYVPIIWAVWQAVQKTRMESEE